MHKDLEQAVNHLVTSILSYKSPTWDSVESNVTQEEAECAAAELIYGYLFDREGKTDLDGGDIGYAIESINPDVDGHSYELTVPREP